MKNYTIKLLHGGEETAFSCSRFQDYRRMLGRENLAWALPRGMIISGKTDAEIREEYDEKQDSHRVSQYLPMRYLSITKENAYICMGKPAGTT